MAENKIFAGPKVRRIRNALGLTRPRVGLLNVGTEEHKGRSELHEAAALIADALAKECEFFSIGTNDLIQYTLAVDRVNETVARLYQPTHPAVLQLIDLSVTAAHAHGLKVSVCGETAADPVMAVLFVGMGVLGFGVGSFSAVEVSAKATGQHQYHQQQREVPQQAPAQAVEFKHRGLPASTPGP